MTSKRGDRSGPGATGGAALAWPDDPETVTVTDIDFEALAHVLANCCRRGGRMRHYHSLAAHSVIVSEEIEALGGLSDEDRRTLALHALVAGAASAWFRGKWTGSARAADRTARAWLARFRALGGDRPPVGDPGGKTSGKAAEGGGTPDAAGA